jgi:hypothetical protein
MCGGKGKPSSTLSSLSAQTRGIGDLERPCEFSRTTAVPGGGGGGGQLGDLSL